jgi:hypothetical protein
MWCRSVEVEFDDRLVGCGVRSCVIAEDAVDGVAWIELDVVARGETPWLGGPSEEIAGAKRLSYASTSVLGSHAGSPTRRSTPRKNTHHYVLKVQTERKFSLGGTRHRGKMS